MQHVSDLHPKFALRPLMVALFHRATIRKKKIKTTAAKCNSLPYWAAIKKKKPQE